MLVKITYINEETQEMGIKPASMKKANKFTIVVDLAGAEAEGIDITDITSNERGVPFALDLDKYEIDRPDGSKWADLCVK